MRRWCSHSIGGMLGGKPYGGINLEVSILGAILGADGADGAEANVGSAGVVGVTPTGAD